MRILIHGAGGRMGRVLRAMVDSGERNTSLAGMVDAHTGEEGVLRSLAQFDGAVDCVIDFSNHTATKELLDYCLSRAFPVVIATTGQTEEEKEMIRKASEQIPVFCSGNMSLGVALLVELAKITARTFPDADIEIIERHHNQKVDVPSGTALMLGNAVRESRSDSYLLTGRHENGKRDRREIGIHSLRMGSTVGIHEVIVHAGTQVITLKHEALDRSLFAEGALAAAEFLIRQRPGLYQMDHIVKDR